MERKIIGKNYSYIFDFSLPNEDDTKPDDLGLLFHARCEQNNTNVIIRYIANTALIKNQQHLFILQSFYCNLNKLHSGIAQTHDCILEPDGIFIVREELIGIDLQTIAFSGDYPHLRNQKFMLRIGEKVCEILDILHKNNIVHRRIQPSNIFVLSNELGQIDIENPTIKLINFEYAQINGQNLLGFSTIPYAMHYSSPEQVLQCGILVNQTSDIYSLGITIYESIIREHAFDCEKDDKNLVINMQLSYPLRPHHRLHKKIFPLLQKATAKHIFKTPPMRLKPEILLNNLLVAQQKRFQSAKELQFAISQLITEIPDESSLLNTLAKKLKFIQ